MNDNRNKYTIFKDVFIPALTLAISAFALFSSFKACELSIDSNKIAQESVDRAIEANKISLESNRISKDANELTGKAIAESSTKANEANSIAAKSLLQSENYSAESLKYVEINAQIMWNTLIESYDNADKDVLEWEKANHYSRANKPVDTLQDLIKYLDRIKISDEGKRLYIKRFDKRMSLIKASEAYEPFKERLSNLNLTLPTAPLLPAYLLDERGRKILDERGRPIIAR